MKELPWMSVEEGPSGRRFMLPKTLPSSAFDALLETLMKNETEFCFHDPKYPQMSDPGAYFSYSPRQGQWRMTLGNHGWSGGIYIIEADVLRRQLQSLHAKGLLDGLNLDKVGFFSQYSMEPAEKNEAMNQRLRLIHSK